MILPCQSRLVERCFHTAMWASQYDRFGGWEFETWKALGWEPMAAIELLVQNEQPYTDW